jgi:hypothetical protein
MTGVSAIVGRFTEFVVDPAILIIVAAGFLLFVWGLVEFLWKMREGGDTAVGKQHMLWGIVGMLIMFSVYGILSIINDTFSLNFGTPDTSRIQSVNPAGSFFTSGQ